MYDLVVVGAGPAGVMLAKDCAEAGQRVLLLDSRPEAEIGNNWVIAIESRCFGELGLPYPTEPETFSTNVEWFLVSPGGQFMVGGQPSPCHEIFMRPYTRRLLEAALKAGVELRPAAKVVGPLIGGGKVAGVKLKGQEIEARITADASGGKAVLRDNLPAEWGARPRSIPKVAAFEAVYRIDKRQARAWMDRQQRLHHCVYNVISSRGGFSTETLGVDLKSGRAALLVGYIDPRGYAEAARVLDEWAAELGFIRERICGGGADIPIRRSIGRLTYDGLVILGDAACMVNSQHGSGMASALHAGRLASKAIVKAAKAGRSDNAALWDYAVAYQRGRGAVMAGFGVASAFSQTLTPKLIDSMLRDGLLTPEDAISAMDCQPMRPSLKSIVERAPKLAANPELAAKVMAIAYRSVLIETHYRLYPGRYRPQAFKLWQAGARLILGKNIA